MRTNDGVTVPVDDVPAGVDSDPDDSGYGWVMFLVFTVAVLVVTLGVGVLAVVGSWWMLGLAVAFHVSVTAAVIWVVYNAFGSDDEVDEALTAPSLTVPSEQPIGMVPVQPRHAVGTKTIQGTLVAHH